MKSFQCDLNLPKADLLSDEEFHGLLSLAQAGDHEALERLVEGNLRLVMSIAMRFQSMGYEIEDLFQIGSMGLLKAIERFDSSFGVKFSTYAVPLIIGEIRQFLRDSGLIRVSRNLKELARQVSRTSEELASELGREASINEIAQKLNVSKEEIVQALEATRPIASIDGPIHEDNSSKLVLDQLASSINQESILLDRMELEDALADLPERERKILELRFFHEKTQSEVALRTGLSQAQVSRLERNALRTLKEYLKNNL